MYEVALEKWQLFGALVIELNTVCKLWVYSKNVFTNFFVELTVVNDHTAVVIVQFFTKNTNRKVEVAVNKSWSIGFSNFSFNSSPLLRKRRDITREIFFANAFSCSTNDDSMTLWLYGVNNFA